LIGLKWTKKPEQAQNLGNLITHFNKISAWIATTVINEEKVKERSKLVIFFLHLAEELSDLNNFSGVMQVLSGLNNAAVGRLKKTFAQVRKKPEHVALWDKIADMMNPEGNYRKYRSYLASVKPPCIPYIGLYLTDLTFIEEGNEDHVDGRKDLINFEKFRMVSAIIKQILLYQTTPYALNTEATIRNFLQFQLTVQTDKEMYEQSLAIEPRDGSKPTLRKRSGTLGRRNRNSSSPGKIPKQFMNADGKDLE